jgi:hypothetical protein
MVQLLDDVIERAKRLSASDRRRLLKALQAPAKHDDRGTAARHGVRTVGPYRTLLQLAGTGHSDQPNIASDKYQYLAMAYGDARDE